MANLLRPARVPPPGAALKRELDARGFTQKEFAEIIGRPEQAISEIVQGAKRITADTASAFASALGTSAELWLNLQTQYDLAVHARDTASATSSAVSTKARIFERLPISELRKRGWIKRVTDVTALEKEVLRFLRISSLDQPSRLTACFRNSEVRTPEGNAQLAWIHRVEALAKKRRGARFNRERVAAQLPQLMAHAVDVASAPRALEWLSAQGIAVAVVPHLPKSFTDGATFQREDGTPVIGLSLRYDRIDAFWFTLLHELGHLLLGHQGGYIDDLSQPRDSLPPEEKEANSFAEKLLISPERKAAWLARHPAPKRSDIRDFAGELGRHPGIIVGQLHHARIVPFSQHRSLLEKVTPHLGDWL